MNPEARQHVGRLHRRHVGKSEVLVYDYSDRNVPMLVRMFNKRLRTYRAMGYSIDDKAISAGSAAER